MCLLNVFRCAHAVMRQNGVSISAGLVPFSPIIRCTTDVSKLLIQHYFPADAEALCLRAPGRGLPIAVEPWILTAVTLCVSGSHRQMFTEQQLNFLRGSGKLYERLLKPDV